MCEVHEVNIIKPKTRPTKDGVRDTPDPGAPAIRQIPELRRRTPCRSGLAFASLDHRERDCRHDAVIAYREHCRREHVSLLKAPTRRWPLFSIFPFGFDQM